MSGSSDVAGDVISVSAELSPRHTRRALFALGVGGFGIGTGEFVIMGLLPNAASDLGVSIPSAGYLISIYALGVVIGAPVFAVLGARWPRRSLLIALMLFFALGNLASAIVPGFAGVAAARFLSGLPHGTYFGVAALVAAGLVPREKRAQAVASVFLGLTIATLLGVPLVAAIGEWLGWRAAFAIVGAIGALTAVLVRCWVPFMPGDAAANPLRELGALRRKQVLLTLATGAIGFGGLFSVFSYVKPTMTELAHLPVAAVPIVLALFGIGTVAGNLLGARFARSRARSHRALRAGLDRAGHRRVLVHRALRGGGFDQRAAGGHRDGARRDPADAPDGRGRRRADTGRRAQPFRLQYRQRAGRLARRPRHRRRHGLVLDGLGRRAAGDLRAGRASLGGGRHAPASRASSGPADVRQGACRPRRAPCAGFSA